jgi:hypothetical protein
MIEVGLTEEEQAQAVRAAQDTVAVAREKATRFAEPGEREEVARRIDPATAEVFFLYTQVLDPYEDDPDAPEEAQCVGRAFFAVDPTEGVAVWFGDLSAETSAALTKKEAAANQEGWRRLLGSGQGREEETR